MRIKLKSAWLLVLIGTAIAAPRLADHGKHAPARYLEASAVNWIPLIAPPPAADSAQQQRDLQAVLDMQAANRGGGERYEKALADSEASCFRFADVIGPALNSKQLPITTAFLNRAVDEANAATGILKRYWQRPRPFVISDKVERLADIAPRKEQQEATAVHLFEYSSYPSGHATYGAACALLLTQLVPDKQAALFLRGVEYGESRLIVGAHFPSDLLAGRIVATVTVTLMTQNKNFQRDLLAARNELQRALQLAEAPVPIAVTTKM